jgi:predicted Zn finger-like uncharacterized protein
MKTRCPDCQTSFRVTPDQLKARAGKVRCGQCQTVFNALDSLLDETAETSAHPHLPHPTTMPRGLATPPTNQTPTPELLHIAPPTQEALPAAAPPKTTLIIEMPIAADDSAPAADGAPKEPFFSATRPLSEADVQELGKATGLILPRETTDIPGYSKWVEGMMSSPLSLPAEKASRWPFVLAALLLSLALAGQLAFRFRSEIAITAPILRPALEVLCQALDADIPLPRHVELVSIETSDLQSDPARGNLLVLYATLRNRANYGQAYPSLELSLTDTQDVVIARRVFAPAEYLPAKIAANQPFAGKSDVAVRLWIEATEIAAAGYRLYVFYP